MSNKLQSYEKLSYFALALDPIHVGTGGYRLGRVDMPIVREPGTNLPKIPGTSISGASRTYATMQNPEKWPHCAGQGQPSGRKNYQVHCGKPDCPICVTFGFSKGEGGSFQGLAQFSDAQIVLFPVHSLAGPVWVTRPSVLRDFGVGESESQDDAVRVAKGIEVKDKLNLGWMMLDVEMENTLELKPENFPKKLQPSLKDPVMSGILNRAVLVSDKLFSHIVNDNLEVRTSVSIDPSTGAAAVGALFTYEAMPRGSILVFDVVVNNPEYYCIQGKIPLSNSNECYCKNESSFATEESKSNIAKIKAVVEQALSYFEALGVGGMNTRGMGRLRVFGLPQSGAVQ